MSTLPAGVKLAALSVSMIAIATIGSIEWLVIATAAVLVLFVIARPDPKLVWAQLRPALIFAALAFAINVWFLSPIAAVLLSGRLLLVLALAVLFSLTTPATEVLDVVTRWIRPIGGLERAERFALMVSLTIRSVPLLSEIVTEVQQARRARGMERSVRALVVPSVVRALRSADDLGDALTARGIVD